MPDSTIMCTDLVSVGILNLFIYLVSIMTICQIGSFFVPRVSRFAQWNIMRYHNKSDFCNAFTIFVHLRILSRIVFVVSHYAGAKSLALNAFNIETLITTSRNSLALNTPKLPALEFPPVWPIVKYLAISASVCARFRRSPITTVPLPLSVCAIREPTLQCLYRRGGLRNVKSAKLKSNA